MTVVYIDLLFLLNFIANYLLLLAAQSYLPLLSTITIVTTAIIVIIVTTVTPRNLKGWRRRPGLRRWRLISYLRWMTLTLIKKQT